MARSLIIGAGAVGRALAAHLTARDEDVLVGTRSGTELPGTAAVTLEASDAEALTRAARGAAAIYVCSNPPYAAWQRDWPPIMAAVIAAAGATGARVVLMGNLYAYGRAQMPMREDSPLQPADRKGEVRRRMWEELLAAHRAGRIQAAEVRASDYFGPGAGANAHLGPRFLKPLAASKTAWVVGNPSLPHSWAYLPDIAATLAAASSDGASGAAWHVPHASNLDRLAIAARVNGLRGSAGRVRSYPAALFRIGGTFLPDVREVGASSYQFLSAFTADSARTEEALDVRATPFDTALEATLEATLAAPAENPQ